MTNSGHHDPVAFHALAEQLRAWARGHYPTEAAVDLLLAHRSWLARRDFRDACVGTPQVLGVPLANQDIAVLDFDEAAVIAEGGPHGLPASDSELQILAIAVSLAGYALDRSLADLIVGLDPINTARVLHAIAHAAGWHERGYVQTVSGHVDEVAR